MKRNNMNRLQRFAAPQNMTGVDQIDVTAREIDFVTSFARDVQALLDIMGISRMIEKQNGTQLYIKKASGTLQSGAVAEGDEIPLSQYEVEETPYDSIILNKYKKAVSIEAIAEKGYDAAVEMTDEEFRHDLQEIVLDSFYTQLKAGTLTGTYDSFQMAVSMAIGLVKDKFKTIHRSITGTVVFVNTLDLYEYLGGAQITVQTAFGMEYVENFLGADIMFISSEVEKGKVYATPMNNLVCYYINPANSEFAQAGLVFTTDAETNLIGFHTEGNYGRALSEAYALMGMRLFAEYLDGIAKVSILSQPIVSPTLTGLSIGSLTLSPAFDADVTEYTAATENASNKIIATVDPADAEVTITVNGTEIANEGTASWETGENSVTVAVGGKTYTVTVTKS